MDLAEQGLLDFSVPLTDLSPDSFFAVNYTFLKAHPQGNPEKKPAIFGATTFTNSFLAYYGVLPSLQRAYLIGMVATTMDGESQGFWLKNHDQP